MINVLVNIVCAAGLAFLIVRVCGAARYAWQTFVRDKRPRLPLGFPGRELFHLK